MKLDEVTTGITILRQMLARATRTEAGQKDAHDADPWPDLGTARTWARLLLRYRDQKPPRPDLILKSILDSACERLAGHELLDLEELDALRELLRSCRRIDAFLTHLPGLAAFLPDLQDAPWHEATSFLDQALTDDRQLHAVAGTPLAEARDAFAHEEKTIRRVARAQLDRDPWQGLAVERQPVLFDNRICLLLRALPPGGKARIVGHSRRGGTMYAETTELRKHNARLSDLGDQLALLEHQRLIEIVQALRGFALPLDRLIERVGRVDRFLAEAEALEVLGRDGTGWAGEEKHRFAGRLHNLVLLARLGQQSIALEVDLVANKPLLVSGPNAGGKTAFLTLLVQHLWARGRGLPLIGDGQAVMPWPGHVFFEGGDNQSLDSDESSYSAHLQGLQNCLMARDNDWVIVDELGSKTAPDEGAALGAAWLEAVGAHVGWLVVSSHNHRIKRWCVDHRWQTAALDLNPKTLQPTFRLRPGALGGSHALALARRTGMAESIVVRAEALYRDWYHDTARLGDLEELTGQWEEQIRLLEQKKQLLEEKVTALQQEQAAAANRHIQAALQSELEAVLEKMRATGSKKVVRKLAREATQSFARTLHTATGEDRTALPDLHVGQQVRHTRTRRRGILERVGDHDRDPVTVAFAGGLTLTVDPTELTIDNQPQHYATHRIVSTTTDPEIAIDLQGVRDVQAEEQLSRAFDRLCGDPNVSQIRVEGRHPDRLRILLAPATKRYGREPTIKRMPDSRAVLVTVE